MKVKGGKGVDKRKERRDGKRKKRRGEKGEERGKKCE